VRGNGIVGGVPRLARSEPYSFQLRVVDFSVPHSESLTVNFTIAVSAPRVRLAHLSAPKLVGTVGPVEPADANAISQSAQRLVAATGLSFTNNAPAAERTSSSPSATADQVYASMLREKTEAKGAPRPPEPPTPCDPGNAPLPVATGTTYTIDARDGTTSGKRQFERNQKVSVIIDNQNPYLYTYKFTADKKVIEETAPAAFFPFFGGLVTDFAGGTTAKAAEDTQAKVKSKAAMIDDLNPAYRFLASNGVRSGANGCENYAKAYEALRIDIDAALSESTAIAGKLKQLSHDNDDRGKQYDSYLKTLHDAQATGGQLYCASKQLLEVDEAGAKPDEIETLQEKITKLNTNSEAFKNRVDALQQGFPDCADMVILNLVRHAAEGLISDAAKYDKGVKKISADLKTMNDLRDLVDATFRNPRKFRSIVEIGHYSRTTEVTLALTRTSIEKTDGKDPKAEDLVKTDDAVVLKFGHAPFFSISGGVAFSPLRKLEYDRIQGFERDQQGNLVLVNGKPNLTTVVGLKEGSRSRITPLVLLNGRIHDKVGPIDGIHLTLGITAKNDNKGTDVEYLLGPSFSFLEDNLFLTVGGYAGRQQKLGGGLYEGFAVPSTVSELPIEKNYHWDFGFALSYRIPVNKK
jgi:hypothetical protein